MFSRMFESVTKKALELASSLADAAANAPFKLDKLEVSLRSAIRPYQLEREIEEARKRMAEQGKSHDGHESYSVDYLRSKDWSKIRTHAIRYVGGKCEFCGRLAKAVHHVRYPPKTDRGLESISWLVVVCEECHKKLHGGYGGSVAGRCVLCDRSKAVVKLDVIYKKFSKDTQPVCIRCKALALGLRDVARGWTNSGYLAWLEHWSATVDRFVWSLADTAEATALATKRSSHLIMEPRVPAVDAPVVRPYRPIDMTPDPELARLAEIRRAYMAMPTAKLRAIWDSRESSELGPDELRAVRFAIREKMGLPTDKETSAELDGHL